MLIILSCVLTEVIIKHSEGGQVSVMIHVSGQKRRLEYDGGSSNGPGLQGKRCYLIGFLFPPKRLFISLFQPVNVNGELNLFF